MNSISLFRQFEPNVMNNHTCEMIDFINGGKITKPFYVI